MDQENHQCQLRTTFHCQIKKNMKIPQLKKLKNLNLCLIIGHQCSLPGDPQKFAKLTHILVNLNLHLVD